MQVSDNRKSKWLAGGVIVASLILLAVLMLCDYRVSSVKQGSATLYTAPNYFSYFIGALSVLIGGLAVAFWMHSQRRFRFGAVVLAIMSVLLLLNAPTGFNHHLVVTSESFDLLIGAWYLPREIKFEFASLRSLAVRKSGKDSAELIAVKRSGEEISVPLGHLVDAALPQIFEYAAQRGV